MATIWTTPASGSPGENAYKLFLNYDGAKSNLFGDSVSATTSDVTAVPAYAIYNQTSNKLFVLLFNKDANARAVSVSVAGYAPASAAYYSFRPSSPLASRGSLQVSQGAFNISLCTQFSLSFSRSSFLPIPY